MARLVIYFLLLSLFTVSLIGYIAFFQARALLEQAVYARLETTASLQEAALNRWIGNRADDLVIIAHSPELRTQGRRLFDAARTSVVSPQPGQQAANVALADYLATTLAHKTDFQEIFILSPLDGRILFSTNKTRPDESLDTAGYFHAGQTHTVVQNAYTADGPTLSIATPLLDHNDDLVGILAAYLDLKRMGEVILNEAGNSGGESYLVDSNRRFLVFPNRFGTQQASAFSLEANTLGVNAALRGENGAALYTNYSNRPVIGAYRWLDELDMVLLAEVPQAEAFAPVNRLGWVLFFVALLLLILLTASVYLLSRQMAEPILAVTNTAVQVAAGDLNATATIYTEDEIGTLARTFNQMTERLRRVYASLEAQVIARTMELARRVDQLNLINQVGRHANALLDLNNLLPTVASLIRGTFNYYAVMVLLVDETSEQVYLSAADTTEPVDLVSADLRLAISQPSIITHVAKTGKALLVNDVSADPRYMTLNYLPHTRAELALPLSVGDKVLGVLDLQSATLNSFSLDEVQVMQTLADQIAVAIQNAALFQAAHDARAEAEEANRLKTQFLTSMSHELRTPLNAVINFAYLLSAGLEGPLTESQTDMLNRIMEAGRHLLELINDILDLAKIESGRIDLLLENVKLAELIHSVMSTATGLVGDKQIVLRQEVPDDLPLVYVDRGRIRQVLLNLVANAAKFTERGYILVQAVATAEAVVVSVEDTGVGMAPEDIPQAFTEFVQVEGGLAHQADGTGLGLPISKQLIEMHGGKMWVTSEPGVGSTFYFTLPIGATAGPSTDSTPALVGETSPALGGIDG